MGIDSLKPMNDSDTFYGIKNTDEFNRVIINLELYIANEKKLVQNIKDTLSSLQKYYSSDNNSIVNSKISNLFTAMNMMLDNRSKYIESLKLTFDSYLKMNNDAFQNFNDIY